MSFRTAHLFSGNRASGKGAKGLGADQAARDIADVTVRTILTNYGTA